MFIVECKADIHRYNKENNTPLHVAVTIGADSIVQMLLALGANPRMSKGDSNTPLQLAVKYGHCQIADMLIQGGALLDVLDKDNNTLLDLAIRGGHADVISLLIKHGMNPNIPNKAGEMPLHTAAHFSLFRPNGADCILALIACGANPNALDSDGNTPLHLLATHYGAVKQGFAFDQLLYTLNIFIDILLNSGANSSIQNKMGDTPLHLAAQKNNFIAYARLNLNGAMQLVGEAASRLYVYNNRGQTPLDEAITLKSPHVIGILLTAFVFKQNLLAHCDLDWTDKYANEHVTHIIMSMLRRTLNDDNDITAVQIGRQIQRYLRPELEAIKQHNAERNVKTLFEFLWEKHQDASPLSNDSDNSDDSNEHSPSTNESILTSGITSDTSSPSIATPPLTPSPPPIYTYNGSHHPGVFQTTPVDPEQCDLHTLTLPPPS